MIMKERVYTPPVIPANPPVYAPVAFPYNMPPAHLVQAPVMYQYPTGAQAFAPTPAMNIVITNTAHK